MYFDAHTHIHFPVFDADRETVIKRAESSDVKMLCVGTQISSSASAVILAKQYPKQIWASVGFHPNHASDNWFHDQNEQKEAQREKYSKKILKELAEDPKVVAIGECGLDYYRISNEGGIKEKQKEIFLSQMELASEVKKPLMIHCRNAFADLTDILITNHQLLITPSSGVIHFFTGKITDAEKLLNLGFAFTFGGVITFTHDYDEIIKYLPLDRILSETDAPYVAPVPYRGKRNEPSYIIETVQRLADLKSITLEKMTEIIFENTKRIFNIEK